MMERVCYANPTLLLRRPISELLRQQAGTRTVGLLIPGRGGQPDASLHHSAIPKGVAVYTYNTLQLPGSPFEWPIPGWGFFRQAWRVLHEYDVVHVWAHFYLSTLLLMMLSLFTRTRIILTMDTLPGYSFSLGTVMDAAFKLFTWTAGRIIYGVPETITLYGEALLPAARASGIRREKIRVIPTGIAGLTPLRKRKRGRQRTVLYAGLLNRRKGVGLVLAIARRLPDVRFLIAGDGPDRARLERAAPANVTFLGWRRDLPELLRTSDLLLFPSRAEGLPGIVMEAMYYGTPVVSTHIPCTTDLITHGEHGLLAEPDDLETLHRHVVTLLKDQRLAQRLAAAAQQRVKTVFSWKNVLPQYAALYDERPVLHVITGLGVGGAEHMLLKTIPRLNSPAEAARRRGHREVHLVCSLTNDDALGRRLAAAGVTTIYLGLTRWNAPLVAWRLRRLIRSRRPWCVTSYLLHTNILARFVARSAGVTTIVCSVRNIHRDRVVWNALDRWTQRLVTRYTPNSRAVAAWLRENGIPAEKITVIPNCIDAERFARRVQRTKKTAKRRSVGVAGRKVALCVASFKAQKNHETLLKAFARLGEEWVLLLAGDGPRRGMLAELARSLGIEERVRFLGNRDDVAELLAISDVLVLPSKHEGMPNVLLEAMAARTPIVCSDIPENREVAGSEACYVGVDDVEGLAAAIPAAQHRPRLPRKYTCTATLRQLRTLYATLAN